MTRTEFLKQVVADRGRFCIFAGNTRSHSYFDTPDDAESLIDSLVNNGANVYFAPCTFKTDKREATNVAFAKSLYIDLDCGRDKVYDADGNLLDKPKGYLDKATALAEFQAFRKAHQLPKPTFVVDSGNGIHIYWVLTEALEYDAWKPVATGLKKLCLDNGLLIDPAVTADGARILRPIDTKNFKDSSNPLDVTLLKEGAVVTLEELKDKIPDVSVPVTVHAPMDATTRALMGNKVAKFRNILARGEDGCRQIIYIFENQADIEEPLWRAGLAVAWACEDRNKAIHVISSAHPDYDAIDTQRKAEETQGPYRCETFESLNPGGCEGCPHRGKFASPIRLGEEVLVASPEQNLFQTVEQDETGQPKVVTYQIPDYPFPYVRGINGGVYRRVQLPQGGTEDVMVYRYDFYITKRLTDPERGETLMAHLHLPKDGLREFPLPLMDAMATDRLRDRLAMHGVAVSMEGMKEIMRYITTWTNSLQAEEEAETSRTQFGWADDRSVFILGDREYRRGDGMRYSPPSTATMGIAPLLQKRGTLDAWKSVINMYARPGNEVRAFAFFMGFGAPLLSFTPLKGGLLNLMSPESGTGKSTIQMAINSIYGAPYDLLLQKADTINARIHRVGIMNNLPVTIDEITNMPADQMSELAYAITQGRGKDRMKSQGNELRANNTRWQTLVISSGNSSIYDKLSSLKADPDGEIMRVMEFKVDRDNSLTKEQSDAIFSRLFENYGIAGELYVQYLLDNQESVLDFMRDMQQKVDSEIKFGARERFWSAMVTCAITGGAIARLIGLHDIPPNRILKWVAQAIKPMQRDAVTVRSSSMENVGLFLMDHQRNTLVINNALNASGFFDKPLKEPMGELIVRYEPDTKSIFISSTHFRAWCVERQISYKDLVEELCGMGVMERGVKKRLSTGTSLPGVTVNTVRLDSSKGAFGMIDETAGAEAADC